MKPKRKAVQLAMHCRCGRETMLAHGMCATCYTLRRQDEEHFGGLREAVLERDGYRCRVCDAPGTGKRSIIVHHRVPGRSELKLMISLCPAATHGCTAPKRCWRRCRLCCSCCGGSSIRTGMNKPVSISGESTLLLSEWRCFDYAMS